MLHRHVLAPLVMLALGCGGPQRPPAPTTGAIAGLVHDRATGEPVAATLAAHDQESLRVEGAQAGADGAYRIDGLPPGVYDLVVVIPGTSLQLTGIPVTAGRVTGFDVPIDFGAVEAPPRAYRDVEGDALVVYAPPDLAADRGRLEGVVTDSVTRERVEGAAIHATSPAAAEVLIAVSDDRGQYRFGDVPPGTYELSAFYQVPNRGQIEVRRTGIAVPAGSAVKVPIFVEVTGNR